MARFESAVPVLKVADVGKSVAWYREVLGFRADCFPEEPPHAFAMLTRDGAEIMLQRASPGDPPTPTSPKHWAAYLRLSGEQILALHERVKDLTPVLAGPWRKFYRDVEFEIADPDGHRLCLGEVLPESVSLPTPTE